MLRMLAIANAASASVDFNGERRAEQCERREQRDKQHEPRKRLQKLEERESIVRAAPDAKRTRHQRHAEQR